jgi:hypothetical protein
MNRLRQVLGDSADQPRYIETLPGRGYRFIATVDEQEDKLDLVVRPPTEAVSAVTPGPSPPSQPSRGRFRGWSLAAVGVVSAAAGAYLVAAHPSVKSDISTVRFSVSVPTGFALEPGSSRQTLALSPDGARLAFSAMDVSGVFQAFVRELDALEARPLPNSYGRHQEIRAKQRPA